MGKIFVQKEGREEGELGVRKERRGVTTVSGSFSQNDRRRPRVVGEERISRVRPRRESCSVRHLGDS